MRSSLVFAIIAVFLGSLWYQGTPRKHHEVIGLCADGSPLYASMLSHPGAVITSAGPARVPHAGR